MTEQYAGYFDPVGRWIAKLPEWSDIREAPRDRVYRVLDRGETRYAFWGTHEPTGQEAWLSWVDPTLILDPSHARDLPKPPDAA